MYIYILKVIILYYITSLLLLIFLFCKFFLFSKTYKALFNGDLTSLPA